METPVPAAGPLRRSAWLVRAMGRQARALQLQQTAASLAFLSLLAIVPIISVVFTVLAVLPAFADVRGEIQRFLAENLFVPGFRETMTTYLQRFAARANELSLAATLVFFASAFGMLLTIDRSLNRIWGTARPRPLTQRLTLYWATLTIAPILLGASLVVNGMLVGEWLRGGELRELRAAWFTGLRWLISGLGLTLLYRLVPNTAVRWRDAFLGALLAAVLLDLLRRGFGLYLTRLPTFTVVYGAFAAVPVFLLWLFLLWSAVLTGALFASRLPHAGHDPGGTSATSAGARFLAAAGVLAELARLAPDAHGAGRRAGHWRGHFGNDPVRAQEAAQLLAEQGYLVRMAAFGTPADGGDDAAPGPWAEHWALARPAHELTLRPLFDATWGAASAAAGLAELDEPLSAWARDRGRALGAGPSAS